MYYTKIGYKGAGFTNQIIALITGIIQAYARGEKVLVVDDFLNDINDTIYTPASEIFDLEKMNVFLKEKYDIIIIDKNNVQFEILSVKYGIDDTHYMDLTECVKKIYSDTNKLYIDNRRSPVIAPSS